MFVRVALQNEYFTGGERSGMMVQDPNQKKKGGAGSVGGLDHDHSRRVDGLFNQALAALSKRLHTPGHVEIFWLLIVTSHPQLVGTEKISMQRPEPDVVPPSDAQA